MAPLNNDVLDRIIQHLSKKEQLPPPSKLLPQTKETIRTLKLKQPYGLNKSDTPESRAATCLEFVLRTKYSIQIPLKTYSSSICLPLKKFESVFNALRHSLEKNDVDQTRKRNSASSPASSPSSSSSDIIQTLSIKLGGYAQDNTGLVISQTGKRLDEIYDLMKNNGVHKEALLDDMRRKMDAYAAVCFYLVVRKDDGGENILSKEKVLSSANLNPKDFEGALHQIQILEEKNRKDDTENNVNRQAKGGKKRKKSEITPPPKKRKKIQNESNLETIENLDTTSTKNDETTQLKHRPKVMLDAAPPPSEEFKNWIEQTLKNAIKKEKCHTSHVNHDTSDNELIGLAAERVLRKNGLIP